MAYFQHQAVLDNRKAESKVVTMQVNNDNNIIIIIIQFVYSWLESSLSL